MKGVKRVDPGAGMRIGPVASLGFSATMNEMRGVALFQSEEQSTAPQSSSRCSSRPGHLPTKSSQHGKEQVHYPLRGCGRDPGRGRTDHLPGGDLCSVVFLGLLHLLGIPAHLLQPNPLDLLVHVHPDCVRGRAQPDQARHPVTSAVPEEEVAGWRT